MHLSSFFSFSYVKKLKHITGERERERDLARDLLQIGNFKQQKIGESPRPLLQAVSRVYKNDEGISRRS